MHNMTVKIEGVAPLLMHNVRRFLDPTDELRKEMSSLTSKRKKTDSDAEQISNIEFVMGLYFGQDGPILPAEVIEGGIIDGAKKSRKGTQMKASIVAEDAKLEYNGPRDVEGMLADGRFVDKRPVVVNRAKVLRTRPIFRQWAATLNLTFNPDVMNRSDVIKALEDCGQQCGIGDYRPRFGRSVVVQK